MDLSTPPSCPNCGFAVFNRRYPRCESCGVDLPETLVYTPAERRALLAADEERAAARAREQHPSSDLPLSPFDAAIVSGFVSLTDR